MACRRATYTVASLASLTVPRPYSAWFRFVCASVALIALSASSLMHCAVAYADGAMKMGQRELFRVGPPGQRYCETAGVQCDTVLVKYLSSYSFLRGALRGGLVLTSPERAWPIARADKTRVASFASLHLDGAAAALPGGDMAALSVDAVLARDQLVRLRVTLADFESVFACHDLQTGAWALPFVGMVTRDCSGDAVFGVDLRLLRMQWDTTGNVTQWLSLGPAFELLHNGLGQAHLYRSVVLAVPVDLQSRLSGSAPQGTSLGAGLRVSALYRTPQWESRLRVRHRTALISPEGFARVHSLAAELRLLRNWFANDALVMQTGLSLGVNWASQVWAGQSLWSSRDAHFGFQASLYVGWVNAAPAI